MSTTPEIDLTYINAALTRIGEDPVTALDDGSAQAQIALSNYEIMVARELGAYRWRWATKSDTLSLLDPDTYVVPAPWAHLYQVPSDLLALRNVMIGGNRITFARLTDKIATLEGGSENDVVALYLWRVPESEWPNLAPVFAEGITQRLEALFLRGIGERHDEGRVRDADASKTFLEARRVDAQSQTPVDPYEPYDILKARGGGNAQNPWVYFSGTSSG